nr:MAG TPA: hypothetical protein [Caudoviricetes sp.]
MAWLTPVLIASAIPPTAPATAVTPRTPPTPNSVKVSVIAVASGLTF